MKWTAMVGAKFTYKLVPLSEIKEGNNCNGYVTEIDGIAYVYKLISSETITDFPNTDDSTQPIENNKIDQ